MLLPLVFMSCLIELTWGQMLLPLIFLTDVNVTCWCLSLWLMLLSHMVLMLLFGKCYAMWCDTTSNCCKGQFNCPWLMLLPLMVVLGWCYCHIDDVIWLVLLPEWLVLLPHNCSSCLACVVAMVVDCKSIHGCVGRCYSQGGRWNSHWVNVLILNLMFCVGPHLC